MARRLTADRLAARLARMGGARLSAEEYDAGDGLGDGLGGVDDLADLNKPVPQPGGDPDTARWLRGLLRALGVEVAEQAGPELIALASKKIAELRGGGAKSKAAGPANPLIRAAGNQDPAGGGPKMEPVYMSLAEIEGIADPATKRVALSLATDCDRLNHDRREAAKAHQRQHDAALGEARAARQTVVNRILTANPFMRREVEELLNGMDSKGMAFSQEAATALMALERRVNDQLAKDRLPRSA